MNSFHYKKVNDVYRIVEVKNGITKYYPVSTLREVRIKRNEFRRKDKIITHESPPEIIKSKPKKKFNTIQKVNKFYSSLNEHYYLVKDFTVTLYDDNHKQISMRTDKNRKVMELLFVRFYITPHKLFIDRPDIAFYASKKVGEFYLTLILPKLYFRNKRVYFTKDFKLGKEVSLVEARTLWKTVEKVYGYEETVVPVNKIEEMFKTEKKTVAEKKEVRVRPSAEMVRLGINKIPPLVFKVGGKVIGMKNKSSRSYINYPEINISMKIDRDLAKARCSSDN